MCTGYWLGRRSQEILPLQQRLASQFSFLNINNRSISIRIAVLSPVSWRTPPRHYGPWEFVVSLLTEELVRLGLDVTLFATADSRTSAQLAGVCPHPYSEDDSINPKVSECLHISELFERAGDFDLIHNHFDFLPLTYSGLVETPVVTTIHGFSSPSIIPVYRKYNARGYYVAISESDLRQFTTVSIFRISHFLPQRDNICCFLVAFTRRKVSARLSR